MKTSHKAEFMVTVRSLVNEPKVPSQYVKQRVVLYLLPGRVALDVCNVVELLNKEEDLQRSVCELWAFLLPKKIKSFKMY